MEQAYRCREVIDMSKRVGSMVSVCYDELFMCGFGCVFEMRVEGEYVCAWGGKVFAPQLSKNAFEFAGFRDP